MAPVLRAAIATPALGAFTAGVAVTSAATLGAGAALGQAPAAATVWFLGFFPLTEGLIAAGAGAVMSVPAGVNVAAAVTGNLLVLPLVYGLGAWLDRYRWMRSFRARADRAAPRLRARMDRWGGPAVAAVTPWLGAWATALALEAMGASRALKYFWTTTGILVQVAALQALILLGVAAVG